MEEMEMRQRNANGGVSEDVEQGTGRPRHHSLSQMIHKKKHRLPRSIHKDGESNRSGFHPWHFLKICFQSSCTVSKYVNILWPFVPAAIAIHFARPPPNDLPLATFALNYIAMVPTANLIGFAGQELARKLTKVFGVLLETFLGSIVEIILLMVLLAKAKQGEEDLISVIRDAILGSVLANLLLCLGFCFFIGGLRQQTQSFSGAVSEVGGGLLLTAGFGLAIPRAFFTGVVDQLQLGSSSPEVEKQFEGLILQVSRSTACILLIAFLTYVWFQMRSHHGLYDNLFEQDEAKDLDRHLDLAKSKLTLTECFVALAIGLACVAMHAIFLVEEIPRVIAQDEGALSETFMGLILVPLVEKASEHLTAIDEAWDNQMNFALAHVLGSTVQTALLNASLVVIVGWGLDVPMDLNFSTFQVILLILSIIVVGNFIRDQESNYLEGALCILVYLIIAVATWYFPNRPKAGTPEETPEAQVINAAGVAVKAMLR
jgi:Ca2+:H+ antiporter